MNEADVVIGALCAWREARGLERQGMQSILNVLVNRAMSRKTSVYAEAVRPLQFSSMTFPGDPNLIEYPGANDPEWGMALILAGQMANGKLPDITGGANLYYAPKSIKTTATIALPDGAEIPFPEGWNPAVVQYTVTIGSQVFFKEA